MEEYAKICLLKSQNKNDFFVLKSCKSSNKRQKIKIVKKYMKANRLKNNIERKLDA